MFEARVGFLEFPAADEQAAEVGVGLRHRDVAFTVKPGQEVEGFAIARLAFLQHAAIPAARSRDRARCARACRCRRGVRAAARRCGVLGLLGAGLLGTRLLGLLGRSGRLRRMSTAPRSSASASVRLPRVCSRSPRFSVVSIVSAWSGAEPVAADRQRAPQARLRVVVTSEIVLALREHRQRVRRFDAVGAGRRDAQRQRLREHFVRQLVVAEIRGRLAEQREQASLTLRLIRELTARELRRPCARSRAPRADVP